MTDTAVRVGETDRAHPAHPLDPATAAEYLAGRDILAAAGLLAGPVRFAYYGLEEPPKDEVLATTDPTTTDRRLRAFLVNTDTGESTDVVVSLTHSGIVSARRLDPGRDGQMPILDSDFAAVDEITKATRSGARPWPGGVTTTSARSGPARSPRAMFGPADDDRRRMVRVLAFVQAREHDLAWAHPVDGVAAYVDLVEKKVFKVTDEFELPVPAESGDYDDEAVRGPHRTTLKPIEITQPEGPSFTLDGYALRWQDWSMRIGFDAREGLSLHQVSVNRRPVLYRASIPEMVVPYGDPKFRYWQAYFDTGEYLVGKFVNSLELGCDCLGEIAYLDATVTDDTGQPPDRTERDLHPRGGLRHPVEAHRHLQRLGPVAAPAQARGLLLHHGRQLRLRLLLVLLPGRHHRVRDQGDRGAVHLGVPRRRRGSGGSSPPGQQSEHPYSTEVAPGLAAPFHQHLFSARLDMTVDGLANAVEEVDVSGLPIGPDNPYGNAIAATVTRLTRESQAGRRADGSRGRTWRIVSTEQANRFGRPTSYTLYPESAPALLADPDSPLAARAGFAANHLWVTRYDPAQRWPAGDYVNQNPGGAGLLAFIAGDRDIDGTDLVVWHTFGPTHVPRPEDWPVMPVARCGFVLKPTGFFDRNPTLDVPPPARHCSVG